MFENMGGNIPDGNFLGGNFPGRDSAGGNLIGGNSPGESFPGGIFLIPYDEIWKFDESIKNLEILFAKNSVEEETELIEATNDKQIKKQNQNPNKI